MGTTRFDVVAANAFIGADFPGQGNRYFVKPSTGQNGASGKSPRTALKTLAAALAKCTANQNDVVYLLSESNTAANTTDYQSATLDWNKDLVHLIGVNSGVSLSQRSRVGFLSTYDTASNLFTLSADGCMIKNVSFFAGVAGTNPTGCFKVTGQRNLIQNCHIVGMGNAANDISGAYSLNISGGAENDFVDCVIGVDTVTLGANANSQILFSSASTRNTFKNCKVLLYTNHATNSLFVRAAAGSIDRWAIFEDTQFINAIDSGSTALTYAAVIAAGGSPAGGVYLIGTKTGIHGATDWNSTDSGNVTAIGAGTITAATYGLSVDVTQS